MAQYKPWRDKGYLHKMYTNKRKTLAEIVEDCEKMGYKVTEMTIYNNLKSCGIPIRGGSRNLGKRSVGGNNRSKSRGGFY